MSAVIFLQLKMNQSDSDGSDAKPDSSTGTHLNVFECRYILCIALSCLQLAGVHMCL